jgi:hypothetical protein
LPRKRQLKLLLNYVLGPLLFLVILVSIYRQLRAQPDLPQQFAVLKAAVSSKHWWWLGLALLLMVFNWSIEALKWQRLAKLVRPTSFWQALRSVVAGVSFTMLTPNRMGEYLGRALYFPSGSRVRAATLTLVGSLSQLIVTLVTGMLGLFYLRFFLQHHPQQGHAFSALLVNTLLCGTCGLLAAGALLYFNIHWIILALEKIPTLKKYSQYIHLLSAIPRAGLRLLLLLSALRYAIFLLQYLLFFTLFGVAASAIHVMAGTMVLFLLLAAVPTIALAELGIRGKASLAVFGLFTANNLGVLAATASVWMINIILPAVVGSLLLISVKLFSKN